MHHPVMAADFCSSAAVPNIGELKALTHLNLENTGITGTVVRCYNPGVVFQLFVWSGVVDGALLC